MCTYVTNVYVTNVYVTNVYVTNVYVTNVYVTLMTYWLDYNVLCKKRWVVFDMDFSTEARLTLSRANKVKWWLCVTWLAFWFNPLCVC